MMFRLDPNQKPCCRECTSFHFAIQCPCNPVPGYVRDVSVDTPQLPRLAVPTQQPAALELTGVQYRIKPITNFID